MKNRPGIKVRDMIYVAIFAALIAVCSWISIPAAVPFTLQTFGIFCALSILRDWRGAAAVAVYVLLGLVGLPVFAGFTGGVGSLLGTSGGYIVGFVLQGLVFLLVTRLMGTRLWAEILGHLLGLAACYALGTAWFSHTYVGAAGKVGFGAALLMCVIPFIIPDMAKLGLALVLSGRLRPFLKRASANV